MRTLLVAAFAAAAFALPAPATAQVTLKFSHYAETNHPAHAAAVDFAQKVEKRTNGQVKIQIFPANQLGDPPAVMQQIQAGVIDIGIPTQGQLDKFDKAFATVMIPFAFASAKDAHDKLDGPLMAWFGPLAEKQGFKILGNWEWGFRHITNTARPVNAPADVKGLKIRVPPEIQLEAAMEALGAQVTKIAFPELYLALSQKVVDGQENPIAVIHSLKLWEVQKHMALTGHSYNCAVMVINNNKFNTLSAEQKKILEEEGKAAGNLMRKIVADSEAGQLAEIKAKGIAVTTPDPATFRALMEPALKKIAGYAGEDNVKKFMEIVSAK